MAERHKEQLYTTSKLDKVFPKVDVVDNLVTEDSETPLSAKQGKILKDLIDNKGLEFKKVDSLPTTGESNVIYLVPITDSSDDNKYEEYVWLSDSNSYELLGKIGSVVTDDALDESSTNPLQNKVIAALLKKLNAAVFPLSISVSGGSIYEKRTTQTITVKWSVKEGNNTITPDKVTVNEEAVDTTSTSKTFTEVTTNTTYTVKATKDGNSVSGSTSAVFVNPTYFGAVASDFEVTETNIKALTKIIKNGKGYTGTTALTNGKTCYAYPKSFGALTSIKDANNFEYLGSYTRSEITVWDETYYVYVLTDPVTITNFKQIYS